MKRFALLALLALALFVTLAPVALAHRNGCHAWHSCPSDTGSYVCGDTGHYNYCPGGVPGSGTDEELQHPWDDFTPPTVPPPTNRPYVPPAESYTYTPTSASAEPNKDYTGWIAFGVIAAIYVAYNVGKGSTKKR